MLEGDAFETRAVARSKGASSVSTTLQRHEYERAHGMRLIEPYPPHRPLSSTTPIGSRSSARSDDTSAQPRANRIYRVDGKDRGTPLVLEGMRVLRWE